MRVLGHSSVLVSVCAALALAACGDDGGKLPTGSPDTSLDTQPPAQTNQRHFSFTFSGTLAEGSSSSAVLTFNCSLDNASPSLCTSPLAVDVTDGDHTFSVTAVQEGNADPTPASAAWHVDSTAPDTMITKGPPSFDNATTATIEFTGTPTDDIAKFECAFDSDTYADCTSPYVIDNLISGTHTAKVRAVDAIGNADPTPAQHSWTTDTSTPDTMITSGPAGASVTNGSATFAFTSTLATAAFECAFDGGSFTACVSPIAYNNLPGGVHTFSVRAKNTTTNVVDPTPAERMWMVDATAPTISIDMKPNNPTNNTTPMFTFSSPDTDVAMYECALDPGAFAVCTSPFTGPAVTADGPQTFRIRATDNVGNVATTSYTWTVDTLPPTIVITGGPSGATSIKSPTFTFNIDGEPVSVKCQLDAMAFADCTSPITYAALADGAHTFTIKAVDAAGNMSSVNRMFNLTTVGPTVMITGGPNGPTNDNTPTFTFTVTGAVTIDCRFDGATSYTPCTSPFTSPALADGPHIFEVRGTDSAGNPQSATRSFTVDTSSPTVTITSGPSGPTNNAKPTFTFVTAGSPSKTECRYDTAAFAACTSPFTTATALSQGPHEFDVRVTDDAGNTGTDIRNITVQTTGPGVSITGGPNGPTNGNKPTWTFTTSGSPTSVQCKLDSAAFADCTSPYAITTALPDGTHTFVVQVSDAAANTNSDSRTIMLDTVAPTVTITSGPNGPTNVQTPVFGFSVAGSPTSVVCKIDTATFTACTSPYTSPIVLPEGPHSFTIQVADDAGNSATQVRNFVVDITPPTVMITNPTPDQNNNKPTFTFTSSGNTTTQCKMDTGSFVACASPFTSTALGGGNHTFTVQVGDDAGNTAMASQTFFISSLAPSITISTGPNGSCNTPATCDPTNDNTPTFTFAVGTGWATLACAFDGGSTVDCSAGVTVGATGTGTYTAPTALGSGTHTFSVTACTASANCLTASKSFEVDTTAPTIVFQTGPSGACPSGAGGATCNPTNTRSPVFTFASGGGAVKFECATILGTTQATAFVDCGSTTTFTPTLATDDTYTLSVRVTDAAFNARIASTTFYIDTTPPTVAYVTTPPAENDGTKNPTPTLTYGATDPTVTGHDDLVGALFNCTVDGAAQTCTATSITTPSLSENEHTVVVQARDIAGNPGSKSVTFIEDRTPPSITYGPLQQHGSLATHTKQAQPTIHVTVNNDVGAGATKITQVSTVTCNFVPATGSPIACTARTVADFLGAGTDISVPSTTPLTTGTWTLTVVATDGAGNVSTTAGSAFFVDLTNPVLSAVAISPASPNKTSPTVSFTATDTQFGLDTVLCWQTKGGVDSAHVACGNPSGSNFTYAPAFPTNGSADGAYTFNVLATDTAGNTTPGSVTFTYDTVKPTISIAGTATDAAPTTSGTPSFTVTTGDAAPSSGLGTPTCQIKSRTSATTAACVINSGIASPASALGDDTWTITADISDLAGNAATQATFNFTVDKVGPILTAGSGVTANGFYAAAPTWNWTGTDNHLVDVSTVVCSDTNGGASTNCGTFVDATHITGSYVDTVINDHAHEGAHTYKVTMKDKAGNAAQADISVAFTLDSIAPTIVGGSGGTITEGTTIASTSGTAAFSVTDATNLTVVCGQDVGAGDPTGTCTNAGSNYTYTTTGTLSQGAHSIKIKATDQANNSSTLTVNFKVDTVAPVLSGIATVPAPNAGGFIATHSVQFNFTATDATTPTGVTTTCSIDGAAYATCTSGTTLTLLDGSHTLKVKAKDTVGNETSDSAADAAVLTFTVDATAPVIMITSPANNAVVSTASQTVNFTVMETNPDATGVQCKLNSAAAGACTSGTTFATTLTEGSNTIAVSETDKAGNAGSAGITVVLDTLPPAAGTISGTDAQVVKTVPVYTWNTTDAATAMTAVCKLNGTADSTASCPFTASSASPFTISGTYTPALTPVAGTNTVTIEVTDGASHTRTLTRTFSYDGTPPTIAITAGTTCTVSATVATSSTVTVAITDTGSGVDDTQTTCTYGAASCGTIASHGYSFSASGTAGDTSTVTVNTKDLAGNAQTATCAITTIVPAVHITAGPRGPTNDARVLYSFTVQKDATAECSFDGGAFGKCTTDKTFAVESPVAQKVHTFAVRAKSGDKILGTDKASFELDPLAMCLGDKASGVADLSTLLEKQDKSAIELWFKSRTTAQTFGLFALSTAFTVGIDAGHLVVQDGKTTAKFTLPAKLDLTQWHHYAVSLTAANLAVFVDGVALVIDGALPTKLATLGALVGTSDISATLAGPGAYLDLRITTSPRSSAFAPTFPAMVDNATTALYPMAEAKGVASADLVDNAPDLEWATSADAWSTCAK